MSLIKCPECGKEISNTVSNCIYCGYKINNNSLPPSINEQELIEFINQGEIQSIKYIRASTGYGLNEAKSILKKYMSDNNMNFDIKYQPPRTSLGIVCPRCGSSSITTGARGANGFWGFIGASKTVNRCAKCGHTWTPRI